MNLTGDSPKALFIFNRNLRLEDNPALSQAAACGLPVITAFIFNPRQIEPHDYRSTRALRFMIESLEDLAARLHSRGGRLLFFHGDPAAVAERLIREHTVRHVFTAGDFTPFAREREKSIAETCVRCGAAFTAGKGILIDDPDLFLKKDGTPYTVFTPFFRSASTRPIDDPLPVPVMRFSTDRIGFECDAGFIDSISASLPHNDLSHTGGRIAAVKILADTGRFAAYGALRDYPADRATTLLSAHLKFGTVSPRETILAVRKNLGATHPLIRQIYWRDFFTGIALRFPYVFGGAWRQKYDALRWSDNEGMFDAWAAGETGFPLVDAGMRELNSTGFMHGRARMVCASFLVKDLHIDWRKGERYFAARLIDYDPAVNNGNWQWCASTGCDAQPYFRIFNPHLQLRRFDPETRYVREFVPGLSGCTSREILSVEKKGSPVRDYPSPIIDHRAESRKTVAEFARLR